MNAIAFSDGSAVVYWSALIVALGAAAWLALSWALYTLDGGHGSTMLLFFPAAVLLSVLLSRALHWYCHAEQYAGLLEALSDYRSGGYCLPGLLLGVTLAVLLMGRLGLAESRGQLLDALAPGAALGIGLIRLSELFGNSCRSKVVVSRPAMQHLPLAAPVTSSSGTVEYRFASFFLSFLLLMLLAAVLLRFFLRSRWELGDAGHVAARFLTAFSAMEFLIDSTRYDSSFLRSNGFVSLSQILAGLAILGVMLWYSLRLRRRYGRIPWLPWAVWLLGVAATGGLEYLVQRHGNWHLLCYGLMSISCALLIFAVRLLYRVELLGPDAPVKRKKKSASGRRRSQRRRA